MASTAFYMGYDPPDPRRQDMDGVVVVVSSNLTTTMKTLFEENSEFPDVKYLIKHSSLGPQTSDYHKHVRHHAKTKDLAVLKGGRVLQGLDWLGDWLTLYQ